MDWVETLGLATGGYWVLASAAATAAAVDLRGLGWFRDAVVCFSARGKTWEGRRGMMGLSVEQSLFWHFYLVGLVAVGLVLWQIPAGDDGGVVDRARLNLLLFLVHLVRRLLETKFIMSYSKQARMHLVAYVFGVSYYVMVVLSILPPTMWSGLSGRRERRDHAEQAVNLLMMHSEWRSYDFLTLGGFAVFVTGSMLQFLSHLQLALLRKPQNAQAPAKYYIPKGYLFNFVSAPHYLAEIIIYIGLLLISHFQWMLGLVLWWVVSSGIHVAPIAFGVKSWNPLPGFWFVLVGFKLNTSSNEHA